MIKYTSLPTSGRLRSFTGSHSSEEEAGTIVKTGECLMSEGYVRILNGAMDKDGTFYVLRGRLDPETLDALLIDDYQREALPGSTVNQIVDGFTQNDGSIPDIDLGMRGHQFHDKGNGVYVLRDPVYIIDGQQRWEAAKKVKADGGQPFLGATIHFNTDKEWEVDRFRVLNATRLKVSPNVILRNMRWKHPGIELLHDMSHEDPRFVLNGHVCWQQRMLKMHFTRATTLARAICILHAYLVPGSGGSTSPDQITTACDKIFSAVGVSTLKDNTRALFQLLDDAWGVRTISYSSKAPHMKYGFIFALARVIDNHDAFWQGNKIFVTKDMVHKFKRFNVYDPTVQHFAGGSGQSIRHLYGLLVEHINKGRRTKHLKERRQFFQQNMEPEEEQETMVPE